jgi:hypothetical protein
MASSKVRGGASVPTSGGVSVVVDPVETTVSVGVVPVVVVSSEPAHPVSIPTRTRIATTRLIFVVQWLALGDRATRL